MSGKKAISCLGGSVEGVVNFILVVVNARTTGIDLRVLASVLKAVATGLVILWYSRRPNRPNCERRKQLCANFKNPVDEKDMERTTTRIGTK